MIRRIGVSEIPRARRLGRILSPKGRKQAVMNRNFELPAKKDLQTAYAEPKKNKVLASTKCSHPEYEAVDYCSPLFP